MADKEQDEEKYGSCEGPNSMYIKLISSDEHEFIIKREHALMSNTIEAMLSGPGVFSENQTNQIHFRTIPSRVLAEVCLYLAYKLHYTNFTDVIPIFTVPPEIVVELLMAANFLDC